MTNSKKWQIAIALVLTCSFPVWAGEEPNEPVGPRIKIELGDKEMSWIDADPRRSSPGPIRPTYGADVLVRYGHWQSVKSESFLGASAAASMSPKQREFIENSDSFVSIGASQEVRNYNRILLYAVSEPDARRMIEACIEILDERPSRKRLEYVNRLREDREEMAKAKGLLPGKEALLPAVKADYGKSKESAHPFLADTEAAEQAKQTIVEMGKMLDTLDVELAGIREKLKVIQDYWSQDGAWTKEAFAKLQEMQIIQTIELKGTEARRKAAVAIRQREKDFLDLFDKRTALEAEIEQLRGRISSRERSIAHIEETLAGPRPDMLPPKIYQDKVTIYPVEPD